MAPGCGAVLLEVAMSMVYEAFTKKQKLAIVSSAIFVVTVSLAFAAWVMIFASREQSDGQFFRPFEQGHFACACD